MPVDRTDLERLLPHKGAMCLLDSVIAHDDRTIACRAGTHRAADNPLRIEGRLPALAAIEYAAQATAAHGALRGGAARPGRLVSIRDVRLHASRLDDVAAALEIEAECLAADAAGLAYRFNVSAAGRLLAEGRLTVSLA